MKDYHCCASCKWLPSTANVNELALHGVPVEVHLQTEEMEQVAEMGVTAHWVYKEGGKNDSTTAQVRAQRWLQSLVDIQQNVGNSFEFIENVKSEFFPKEIYVFTPKGRIVELPMGATAVDFAYAVHSDVGNHCVAAVVEHKTLSVITSFRIWSNC